MLEEKAAISAVDRKMSVIIALLLKIANNGSNTTLKDQIAELASFGLSSTEIANILGKKTAYVSKELSELKKKQK